jgi:hypothetical protein
MPNDALILDLEWWEPARNRWRLYISLQVTLATTLRDAGLRLGESEDPPAGGAEESGLLAAPPELSL